MTIEWWHNMQHWLIAPRLKTQEPPLRDLALAKPILPILIQLWTFTVQTVVWVVCALCRFAANALQWPSHGRTVVEVLFSRTPRQGSARHWHQVCCYEVRWHWCYLSILRSHVSCDMLVPPNGLVHIGDVSGLVVDTMYRGCSTHPKTAISVGKQPKAADHTDSCLNPNAHVMIKWWRSYVLHVTYMNQNADDHIQASLSVLTMINTHCH